MDSLVLKDCIPKSLIDFQILSAIKEPSITIYTARERLNVTLEVLRISYDIASTGGMRPGNSHNTARTQSFRLFVHSRPDLVVHPRQQEL